MSTMTVVPNSPRSSAMAARSSRMLKRLLVVVVLFAVAIVAWSLWVTTVGDDSAGSRTVAATLPLSSSWQQWRLPTGASTTTTLSKAAAAAAAAAAGDLSNNATESSTLEIQQQQQVLLELEDNTTAALAATTPDRHRSLVALAHFNQEGCMEVNDGLAVPGNSFVMGDCTVYEHGVDFDFLPPHKKRDLLLFNPHNQNDDVGLLVMLRLRLNVGMCMQASHTGVNLGHGSWMRVYPCDANNPLQRFWYSLLEGLRLDQTQLCVAFWGTEVNLYDDHLLLTECQNLEYLWVDDFLLDVVQDGGF